MIFDSTKILRKILELYDYFLCHLWTAQLDPLSEYGTNNFPKKLNIFQSNKKIMGKFCVKNQSEIWIRDCVSDK